MWKLIELSRSATNRVGIVLPKRDPNRVGGVLGKGKLIAWAK